MKGGVSGGGVRSERRRGRKEEERGCLFGAIYSS